MTAETRAMEEVTSWQAKGVSVSQIERELSALWRPAPGTVDDDQALAMRTSVVNLVVYAEGAQAATSAAETVIGLAGSHPSRAIIVEAEPQHTTSSLDASLSAHCHIAATGAGKFCCEQVIIAVKGEAAQHAGGVVSPLLLPDLPTVVWWQGASSFTTPLFRHIVEVADCLVVDAEEFGSGKVALRRAQEVRRALSQRCVLADLAWTRLAPWREQIALSFDDVRHRDFVHHLHALTLTYNGTAAPADGAGEAPVSAGLLAGWIAARTGVAPSMTTRWHWQEGFRHGQLLGVELEAELEGHTLRLSLRRDGVDRPVVVQHSAVDGVPEEERCYAFYLADDSALLARELESYQRDPIYEAALAAAVINADAQD